jgi:hypothetical protein
MSTNCMGSEASAPARQQVLDAILSRALTSGDGLTTDLPFGLWTKCDAVFADYFTRNWEERGEALAFLLYDSPPVFAPGSPVFIHSDKNLRLLARFRESQFVSGHKQTVPTEERLTERERVWSTYRERTVNAPSRAEFDVFWGRQNGVRALFLMDNILPLGSSCHFKEYGRSLE